MHDAVQLEEQGLATVVLATPGFVDLAREQALALGLAGLRVLAVPSLIGLPDAAVQALGRDTGARICALAGGGPGPGR